MHLYVELWRFRPAWLGLSQGDRKSWMDKLLAGLQQQLQSGVEVVGLEVARKFEDFVETSGLHEYYEQVNTRGQMMEMEEVVSALLNAQNR